MNSLKYLFLLTKHSTAIIECSQNWSIIGPATRALLPSYGNGFTVQCAYTVGTLKNIVCARNNDIAHADDVCAQIIIIIIIAVKYEAVRRVPAVVDTPSAEMTEEKGLLSSACALYRGWNVYIRYRINCAALTTRVWAFFVGR